MFSFLICLALLIGGYFVYGGIVEKTFGPDDRETPAVKINDGVDYVVLPQWKLFMIQLLNIAGLGPIFGALQGALWGPIVFLWITFGTIFAGAVHDYFSGMMSERNEGASISEIAGIYLGGAMKNVMRVFSVVLLVMVGTVFAVGPAGLIVTLFKNGGHEGIVATTLFWLIIVLVYYFIATFISIDKIIGKIYPLFGICLIIMAIGVAVGIFTKPEYTIPEIWNNFGSMHPSGTPVWSFMFITVACGAISGFHATQSPLMARCMKSEKQGHFVFYGAMVCEGVIALIWAAAGCSLYEVTGGLNTGLAAALANGGDGLPDFLCRAADFVVVDDFDALLLHERIRLGVRRELTAAGRLQVEDEEREMALFRDAAVELTQRSRGTVARIGKGLQPQEFLPCIDRIEGLLLHVHFTADLEIRQLVLERFFDVVDDSCVLRDILALHDAVAARDGAHEHTVLVAQRHGEAVNLFLDDELRVVELLLQFLDEGEDLFFAEDILQ